MKQYIIDFAVCTGCFYERDYFARETDFIAFPDVYSYGEAYDVTVFEIGVGSIGTKGYERMNDAYISGYFWIDSLLLLA
jgi:HKD family nuclease